MHRISNWQLKTAPSVFKLLAYPCLKKFFYTHNERSLDIANVPEQFHKPHVVGHPELPVKSFLTRAVIN